MFEFIMEKIFFPLSFLFVIGVVLVSIVIIPIILITENKCAELGYKEYKVTYNLTRYCITRVDQTDVVVPLKELMKGDKVVDSVDK